MIVSAHISKLTHFCAGLGRSFRSYVRRHRFDLFAGAVLLVMAAWLISYGLKAYRGHSEMVASPVHLMRLQIINGSGSEAAVSNVADRLDELLHDGIGVEIVAAENFDIRKTSQTMVLSREEDLTQARLLARHLGLDPEAVFFKRLENNRRQISATLILGGDYRENMLRRPSSRERTGKS